MKVKRTFFPGDTWFYMKIYCGNVFANQLLSDVLFPILEQSDTIYGCNKWFFIRYSDPEPHIRLRFEIKEYPILLKAITDCLDPYKQQGIIWNVEISTYKRELERYLPENIETCESVFGNESIMLVHLLRQNLDNSEYMVISISLVGFLIDTLINDVSQRIAFLSQGYRAFKNEFKINSAELAELNNKYKVISNDLLEFNLLTFARNNSFIEQFMKEQKNLTKHLVQKEYITPSIIHMFVLRLFHSDNRIMECIVYHHLEKCYRTKNALSKQQIQL